MPVSQLSSGEGAHRQFATTHWSMVVAARDRESPQAHEALAGLCTAYWYPLYAFIRRQGYEAHDAQDLTQEFFSRLLEKDFLGTVDPEKGKFRSYLLVCCKHFLANERDKAGAARRGGGRTVISVDFMDAESRYGCESAHVLPADKLYERRWAMSLLEMVLGRLRDEFERDGKKLLFDRLKSTLAGSRTAASYAELGAELDLSEGAIKVIVHRLRRRYRELLREEIGRTVSDPAEVDAEIRELFVLLSS